MPSRPHSISTTAIVTSTLCRLDLCSHRGNRHCEDGTSGVVRGLAGRCHTALGGSGNFLLLRDAKAGPAGARISMPVICTSCCFVRTLVHGGGLRGANGLFWSWVVSMEGARSLVIWAGKWGRRRVYWVVSNRSLPVRQDEGNGYTGSVCRGVQQGRANWNGDPCKIREVYIYRRWVSR